MVRRTMYELHFGYRKFSISDMFFNDPEKRGQMEKLVVSFFEGMPFMGKKAGQRLRTLEDVWQALVVETKDILVVKSGVTLFWNVVSNISLQMVYGVGLVDMARHHRVAYAGITAWQKDSEALMKLEAQRASGYIIGSAAELDAEIADLQEQLNRNPVKPFVEAGMLPTIVEDVTVKDDLYSYKSKSAKKLQKYVDKVPKPIRTAASWAYVAHDTPAYKVLAHGTVVSDFLAKYTLYQKVTTRSRNPMNHEDALRLASSAFVNYDLPSHKALQYMNDTGLLMFTKYYMRIQHAMVHMYSENPARALMMATLDNYFSGLQTIMDSSVFSNINWPFNNPIDNMIGALDEGVGAKALGKLF